MKYKLKNLVVLPKKKTFLLSKKYHGAEAAGFNVAIDQIGEIEVDIETVRNNIYGMICDSKLYERVPRKPQRQDALEALELAGAIAENLKGILKQEE